MRKVTKEIYKTPPGDEHGWRTLANGTENSIRVGWESRINDGVTVGDGVQIGSSAYIGGGSKLMSCAVIGDGAYIGPQSVIGECVQIVSGATVGEGSIIRETPMQIMRSDGYVFLVAWAKGELRVTAGCRTLTLPDARLHWQLTRGGTPLGDETFAILDILERFAPRKPRVRKK